MSWLISRALMEAYANSPSSPGLVAEYSAAGCLGGTPSAPAKLTPTPEAYYWPDKTTGHSRLSRFGMTFAIDISMYQRKISEWTKNTGTAKGANALSVAIHSSHETRGASSNAARTHVVVFFKQGRRHAPALSAGRRFCRLALNTKHAPANVEPFFACLAGSLTQWSKSETGLPCFAAHSLQDACGTRPTELHRFSGIRLRNCGRTLRRISSLECRGKTTGRGLTNGV